jgi:hypothetical protein
MTSSRATTATYVPAVYMNVSKLQTADTPTRVSIAASSIRRRPGLLAASTASAIKTQGRPKRSGPVLA